MKINLRYQVLQYGAAVSAALPVFVVLSVYLFYRRGYYDLYIANKAFAEVSAVLFGIVLLIGPLSRFFSFPDKYVQYRKELGIVGFFMAFLHVIVSLFFLPARFPLERYFASFNWPFVYGVLATLVLLLIFLISNDRAMTKMGREKWWRLQYWGMRIAFALTLLHVFVMKWNSWSSWYQTGGGKGLVHPEWPGAGLLVAWFMGFVVLVRLAEFINPKLGKIAWYLSVVTLPVIFIATFLWGQRFI